MNSAIDALVCALDGELPLASLSAASVDRDEVRYQLDEHRGKLACAARQTGMFAMRGHLTRFTCGLAFDRAEMRLLRIELALDLASFELDEWEAPALVPLAQWLDVVAHPTMQFRSTAVAPSAQSRHVVRGLLEFDGVTRLQALDLAMSPRRQDAITGTDVVDLTFTGRYREMALGIPLSDQFISNALDLRLAAAVELEG